MSYYVYPGSRRVIGSALERDGIMYRRREGADTRLALVLIHGLGAHAGRWEALADFLAAAGIASYALELKGFGQTTTRRGHIDSFGTYIDDIAALLRIVRAERPGAKLFLVGESMGGLIAFLAAARSGHAADGLILISPAFKSILAFPLMQYLSIYWYALIDPLRPIPLPFGPSMCTRDMVWQERIRTDPLETHAATGRLLTQIASAQGAAWRVAPAVNIPTLFLLAGADTMISTPASIRLFDRVKAPAKKMIVYPDMRHALSIEIGREKVFGDMLEWIRAAK